MWISWLDGIAWSREIIAVWAFVPGPGKDESFLFHFIAIPDCQNPGSGKWG